MKGKSFKELRYEREQSHVKSIRSRCVAYWQPVATTPTSNLNGDPISIHLYNPTTILQKDTLTLRGYWGGSLKNFKLPVIEIRGEDDWTRRLSTRFFFQIPMMSRSKASVPWKWSWRCEFCRGRRWLWIFVGKSISERRVISRYVFCNLTSYYSIYEANLNKANTGICFFSPYAQSYRWLRCWFLSSLSP